MKINKVDDTFSATGQITAADIPAIKAAGFSSIICNRPDGEGADQTDFPAIAAAGKAEGLEAVYIPLGKDKSPAGEVQAFAKALSDLPSPILGYCRSGMRSTTLWSLAKSGTMPDAEILSAAKGAGYDLSKVMTSNTESSTTSSNTQAQSSGSCELVIVGAGAAGIAVAASLKARKSDLEITIVDPAETHYYQPGWTMVGGGIFQPKQTARAMDSLIPRGVKYIKAAVAAFEPEKNTIILDGGESLSYQRLIVCPGLKLDWDQIEGLRETLGKNGVTSNYRYDLAPYTWELVEGLKEGRAIFTQPPMPIKCAGAPQKALYLSGDAWHRRDVLKNIDIQFNNAGGVLFGVKEYVPALMEYVKKYDASLNFFHNLVAVDGPAKKAWFDVIKPDTPVERIEMSFDMMHVCPPQTAPDFIRESPLVDAAGWVDVDQTVLRHKQYDNIWSLGDVMNAPNAKTAAAARMQAPVVAENIVADIQGHSPVAQYNGYGSCPLTVERGKIVLAEFGYGGTMLPSFPKFLLDGTKPSRAAWFLKERMLPPIYWQGMLKGREWMATPEKIDSNA